MAEKRRKKTEENSFRGDRVSDTAQGGESETNVDTTGEEHKHYKVTRTGAQRTTNMSMIDPSEWNLDEAHEPIALRDGSEVTMRIIEVQKGTRDEGGDYYTVRMEVPSEPYSKDVADWLDIPSRGMDAKRLNAARFKMQQFASCFGIDMSRPCDPTEDWVGLEGWCILSLRKSEQYGDQNRISKFILPR